MFYGMCLPLLEGRAVTTPPAHPQEQITLGAASSLQLFHVRLCSASPMADISKQPRWIFH